MTTTIRKLNMAKLKGIKVVALTTINFTSPKLNLNPSLNNLIQLKTTKILKEIINLNHDYRYEIKQRHCRYPRKEMTAEHEPDMRMTLSKNFFLVETENSMTKGFITKTCRKNKNSIAISLCKDQKEQKQ